MYTMLDLAKKNVNFKKNMHVEACRVSFFNSKEKKLDVDFTRNIKPSLYLQATPPF